MRARARKRCDGIELMVPSLPGLAVCVVLLVIGAYLRSPIIIALLASLPFGSTAFAELTAVGGSTPLIYTLMSVLLICSAMRRASFFWDLRAIFRSEPVAWLVLGLVIYSIGSAILLPRIFAGETTAFVILQGRILEQPLIPTTGNFTQVAYFALGALTFYALLIELTRRDAFPALHSAFFTYVVVSILLGFIDLAAKVGGLGDLLFPIRTANYTLLTEVSIANFWRIVGAAPEASTFGLGMMSCLAFALTYWRNTGDRWSLVLAILSFALCLLSTSTTAYAGLAVMGIVQIGLFFRQILRGRLDSRNLAIIAVAPVVVVSLLAIHVVEEKALQPVVKLVDTVLINKASSASGQERDYWNRRSLATLSETHGLGTGFGSSRASSWIIAVISQLGLAGSALMGLAVLVLLRGPARQTAETKGLQVLALARSARASAFAFLVGGALSGGAADPGVLFFIVLAVCVATRHNQADAPMPGPLAGNWNALPTGGRA